MMWKQKQEGIAVVTVLWTTVIVGGLLTVVGINVVQQLRSTKNNEVRNEMVSLADSLSEVARISLYDELKNSNKTAVTFLYELRTGVGNGTYPAKQVTLENGVKGAWTVKKVSADNSAYGWVDIHATVKRGNEKQTIVRRISFGENNVFKLAMLTETVNCMFCHFEVNGDVGTYQKFRPGWGADVSDTNAGSGSGSGAGSNIDGNVYSAVDSIAANRDLGGTPKKVNGATVNGNIFLNTTESKEMLPSTNGVPTFPPIKKAVALANANGTAKINGTSARIIGLPFGTNFNGLESNKLTSLNKTFNGNVVLVGTADDPIRLDKDIYVTGDVVIKGVVTGRGAIYAGRNVYIAGNVQTANPPDPVNTGVCSGVSNPDICAQRNVAAGKDELRIAARSNIVVGDYTRFRGTTTRTADDRQSAEFMEEQFGFAGSRRFSTVTGEEVLCDGSGKNCRDTEGNSVPDSNVFSKSGARDPNLQDGYSFAMRPGVVNGSTKTFTPWMSDVQYSDTMLGYANDTFRSWRSVFSRGSGANATQRQALIDAGIPPQAATTINNWLAARTNNKLDVDETVNGVRIRGYADVSGSTVRFILDNSRSYKKQVTKVDAFLYANQRIGGTILNSPAEFNGGMIGREIGILAPSSRRESWMGNTRYNSLYNLTKCKTIAPNSEDCAMTLNYDHRLRNNGYGYNLVKGEVGQTAQWKLSGDPADDVAVN